MPKDEDAAAWTVGMTEEADGTFKLEIVDDGDGLGARPAPAVAATQSAVWPVFGALCALALALLLVGTAMPLLLLLLPMLMLPPHTHTHTHTHIHTHLPVPRWCTRSCFGSSSS